MSEHRGADAGPPLTLRAGLRRWFLRPPRPHGEVIEDRTVSFLELFYDLVYVVLIAQVAHTLAEDVTWSGVLDFAVVFGLIWIGWFNGTQFHELHGREDGRNRSFIFLQMGILTVLAVFTGHAASTDGEQFALTYARCSRSSSGSGPPCTGPMHPSTARGRSVTSPGLWCRSERCSPARAWGTPDGWPSGPPSSSARSRS